MINPSHTCVNPSRLTNASSPRSFSLYSFYCFIWPVNGCVKLFKTVCCIIGKLYILLRLKLFTAMPQVRATTKFNGYNYNALNVYAQAVHDAMTAAAVTFPTPPVTMANFQTDINLLVAAIAAWGVVGARGSHADLINLRAAFKQVQLDMRALQGYVNTIAAGNAVTVTLSGFTGTNPHSVIGVLNAPTNFRQLISRSTLGNQAILKWKKPTNIGFGKAACYVVQYYDGLNYQQLAITSRTKATVALPTGQLSPLQVRCYAVNNAGAGAATAPITIIFMP